MSKICPIPFFLLIFSTSVYSQDITLETYDINTDGYVDTVTFFYEGGRSSGGNYCSIVNGKNGHVFELNTENSFGFVKARIDVPKELLKKKNTAFLGVFKEKLLPPMREEADPTLQWILDTETHLKKGLESRYYNVVTQVKPRWIKGEIESPDTYYLDQGDHWLIYYGHNHHQNNRVPLYVADSSETYTVYATAMGVAVKKADEFAWVYTSDIQLFGGPEKLRWAAMPTIILKDDYLFIWQSTAPDLEGQIVVVDILTGSVGLLNWQGAIELEGDTLAITNAIKTIRWPIAMLIEALNEAVKF